ncbi:hypothetical protein BS47DRAFT_1334857 [Hydnum rufescens UP504]|uniref:3-hydroxyisobutyryl-CoA hydrolase n=1 Tax=Hydnum rufescens UP504 TaxID=1448309 RepID=A0A9P6AD29_9AGAM|nr:hypothetical protein BS47DRAFT_1334857 [Hydnum rufescens UP504]
MCTPRLPASPTTIHLTATESTMFAVPEATIGCFPDVGSTYVLVRLDAEIGTYLAVMGNSMAGYQVYHLCIATHYIPSHHIPPILERLGALKGLGPHSVNETLDEFDRKPSSRLEVEFQLSIGRGQVRVGR